MKRKVKVAQLCLTLCDQPTPWTVAHQAPLSMRFSRQESWSTLPFPSPGDLPDPGIKPGLPALQADSLPSEPPRKPCILHFNLILNLFKHLPSSLSLLPQATFLQKWEAAQFQENQEDWGRGRGWWVGVGGGEVRGLGEITLSC